ncbi:MAG TPA: PIN domain-containing protein [Candidatus Dormibacteraeota bacterium]|nr:PIN domain-containing protein [Candidatus Dormibacteraeota bacterium]
MLFIDTNIFIYAHDETDIQKTQTARKLLAELSATKKGCLSTQVIQEFCNIALKKSTYPLKARDVRLIVRELLIPLLAHQPDAQFYLRTLETYDHYSLSF